jgi:hypothetical protein
MHYLLHLSLAPFFSVKYLTIRGVPSPLARALAQEKARRGKSLNQTVIELLSQALGLGSLSRSNGLREHAGTWTDEELAGFEEAVRVTEQVDAELWR